MIELMNMILKTQVKPTSAKTISSMPVQNGFLKRKCTRCNALSPSDDLEENRNRRLRLQRQPIKETEFSTIPHIVHDVLLLSGKPLDPETRAFAEPRFGHNFSKVQVHPFVPETEQGQRIKHAYSGKSDCSPTWYGDTSPEVDPSGGSFTGKLVVKYNDAELKDPCVRECVELHESVHVKHLTPIVKKIHDCDVAAGNDWDKKGKCNEMATRELKDVAKFSECEAYRKSFTCLTLKVLDSSSPCSKPPHRDEVQKHRGYEGCEMKKACAEAGTPEAGIPNV